MGNERTAVLMIRAWAGPSPPAPLRVSIRYTSEVGRGAWHTVNLADADAVARFVGAWLLEIETSTSHAELPTPAEDG